VATATPLHLIEPLGFSLADRYLKRAGLDYWPDVDLNVWPTLKAYLAAHPGRRVVASSAKRGEPFHRFPFAQGDSLLLGPEDTGLPKEVWSGIPDLITIPFWGPVRSLNLANAAAVLAYAFFERIGGLDDT
jgi:tRNA (cytidine/uridine-2'-O-)-methyltransferase